LAGSASAILSQTAAIRDITWERGQPLRNPIKYNAYGVIGDRIITACGTQVPGVGGEHWNKRAWVFDPVRHTYENLPDAPQIIGKTTGTVYNDALYVVGGTTVVGKETLFTRQVWRLARESGSWRWQEMPPLSFPRIFGRVVAVNDKLIVLGGRAVY